MHTVFLRFAVVQCIVPFGASVVLPAAAASNGRRGLVRKHEPRSLHFYHRVATSVAPRLRLAIGPRQDSKTEATLAGYRL